MGDVLITLIPAFNEAATIGGVVERARVHAPVIVIDDGSTDDTAARAEAAGADVIRHERRLGKGQAIRTGMAAASVRGATAVVTLDADGQHDPADIPLLRAAAGLRAAARPGAGAPACEASESGLRAAARPGAGAPACEASESNIALVIGGRLGTAGGFVRGRLNAVRVAGFFMKWVTGLHVEDTQSGFRLYPLALVRALPTRRGGFVFETEVLVAAARQGVIVREVPVRTSPRTAERSHFRPVVDGVLIGAYLTGRGLARWVVEVREMVGSEWWRDPRRQRAAVAARGTALAPVLLALAIGQSVVGVLARRLAARSAPDLVTPVVTRWFSLSPLAEPDSLETDDRSLGPPRSATAWPGRSERRGVWGESGGTDDRSRGSSRSATAWPRRSERRGVWGARG